MPVCVPGTKNHPLAGYRSHLHMMAAARRSLHIWLLSGMCVPGAPGPVGRFGSLMLSPPWSSRPGLKTAWSQGHAAKTPRDCKAQGQLRRVTRLRRAYTTCIVLTVPEGLVVPPPLPLPRL